MPLYNSEIVVALSNQVERYSSLQAVTIKHNLTLYNIFTPGTISSIDSEINANPFILSEAMAFLESATHLSLFYTENDDNFVEALKKNLSKLRCSWKNHTDQYNPNETLQTELMGDYFFNSYEEGLYFLDHNPAYMGLYIYVLVKTLSLL